MQPDYDPPRPYLRHPLRWDYVPDDEHGRIVRLWSRKKGLWSHQKPWTGAVHEALGSEATFDDIVAAVRKALGGDTSAEHARRRAGTYLFSLMDDGYVGMDFPEPPARFAPHLETVKELGRGGVGVAWLCHDSEAGHDVVVKHGWDYFVPMATADRLMRGEDEVLRGLDHDGIIRHYDGFERDGVFCLVREFVDGAPLAAEALGDDMFTRRARELVEIADHIHDRGWLLLDFRPANFHVRKQDDAVVLVDVGICIPHEGIGPEHELRMRKSLGSPGYSAPETRRRHRASTASDVFGLGRLLFSLASGRRPLKDWTTPELLGTLGDHPFGETIGAMCASDPAERPSLETVRARLQD